MIPTTYAGSEVTNLLGETAGGEKKTQRSPKILPEAVIYDVELTLSLPPKLSATSGMNAMAHAVEALYAKDSNPITSMMAEEGLRAFASSLPRIVDDPNDRDARTNAQYGAWLCGMCLANTTIAIHHKLCHVLGGTFDLPHAETHAIVLPHAVAYNAPATPEAMSKIARALGASDAATGLYDLAKSLKIPLALKDIGMPADGIDRVVELALKDPYWNPRPLEEDGIAVLIKRAYEGTPPPSAGLLFRLLRDPLLRRRLLVDHGQPGLGFLLQPQFSEPRRLLAQSVALEVNDRARFVVGPASPVEAFLGLRARVLRVHGHADPLSLGRPSFSESEAQLEHSLKTGHRHVSAERPDSSRFGRKFSIRTRRRRGD